MIVTSLYAEGYIGILNGLGLESISIDFTKCKNKIIVIKGNNGCGKSSLFNIIHPLNDSNDSFCSHMNAKKIISFYDKTTGIRYTNTFTSELKNGNRTTRGYIAKILPTGQVEELNPNGNITECRELIFEIFKLDSNFISLSQLSTNDRGLADKKPADRKKFINSIINNLSVYNNMYKSLSKRSSIFKATINSINSKISSIGDEELININLSATNNRITELEKSKDSIIMNIAVNTESLNSLDADDIMNKFNKLLAEYNSLENEVKKHEDVLASIHCKLPTGFSLEDATKEYDDINLTKNKFEVQQKFIFTSLQEELETLENKNIKLNSLINNDKEYSNLKNSIKVNTDTLERLKEILSNSSIVDPDNTDPESYKLAIQIILQTKSIIDHIQSSYDYNTIQRCLSSIGEEREIITQDMIDILRDNATKIKMDIVSLSSKKEYSDKMNNIPEQCTLKEECYFVKDIIAKGSQYSEDKLIELSNQLKTIESDIDTLVYKKKKNDIDEKFYNDISKIHSNIQNSSRIISKIKGTEILSSQEVFNNAICNNINIDVSNIRDVYNELVLYKNTKDNLEIAKMKMNEYSSKDALVEEITNDIEVLSKKIDILKDQSYNATMNINNLTTRLADVEILINNIKTYNSIKEQLTNFINDRDLLKNEIGQLKENADKVSNIKSTITNLISENDIIKNELTHLYETRDTLKFNLIKLTEYLNELEVYSDKYEKIEVIKQGTSPTSGVQTLFMEIYMNKIIEMANQLLSMLFEGKFVLLPFVINESEFRIPCSGNELINDDISSMSTSQICMISMVLSFALLFHSSSKYNILKLDEIDGGLDAENRLQFISLLDRIMNVMDCDQCIMISHNNELNLKNVDIIALKTNEVLDGNIIYNYYEGC